MTKEEFNQAVNICKKLQKNGHVAVFTGGCVRDMLLGKPPKDVDIATDAHPVEIELMFEKTLPIGKAFGVITVVTPDGQFEVATFRQDVDCDGRHPAKIIASSIEEDAKRRDFTMNALFFDPVSKELMDLVGGVEDITSKVVRFVGNPEQRLEEDGLRALRAIRFASTLEFILDESSLDAIKSFACKGDFCVSKERIKAELDKILLSPRPSIGLNLLKNTGMLKLISEKLNRLSEAKHSMYWHTEGDPWDHSMIVLDTVREHTEDISTLWSAFLHDIGKKDTCSFYNGDYHNLAHDKVGAKLAEQILREFKSPREQIKKVKFIVDQHMRIKLASEMSLSKVKKIINEEFFEDLFLVSKMDTLTTQTTGDKNTSWIDRVDNVKKNIEIEGKITLPKPLIGGDDLIKMGLMPGPLFRGILEEVSTLQLNEEISTKEEALDYVVNMYGAIL